MRRETKKEMKRKSERKKLKGEEKEILRKRQRVVGQGQRRR